MYKSIKKNVLPVLPTEDTDKAGRLIKLSKLSISGSVLPSADRSARRGHVEVGGGGGGKSLGSDILAKGEKNDNPFLQCTAAFCLPITSSMYIRMYFQQSSGSWRDGIPKILYGKIKKSPSGI
jgi:hypothetical protein